jgi:hypothetical protein
VSGCRSRRSFVGALLLCEQLLVEKIRPFVSGSRSRRVVEVGGLNGDHKCERLQLEKVVEVVLSQCDRLAVEKVGEASVSD